MNNKNTHNEPFAYSKKIIPSKVFICISLILFTLFSLIALISSSWIYRVSIPYSDSFGLNQLNGEQYYYAGPQPYLIEMPNLAENDEDLRPEIFYYEAPEAFLFQMNMHYFNITTENYTKVLFDEMENRQFFNLYGHGTYGLFSIDLIGDSREPQIRYQFNDWGIEPKFALKIPDITGDLYPDIFMSVGALSSDLPNLDNIRYFNYSSYFRDNPEEFNGYYQVEFNQNDTLFIHAKYSEYSNFILDGKSLNTVSTSFSVSSDPVIDAIIIRDSEDLSQQQIPILVIAQSNIDRTIYFDDFRYFKGRGLLSYDIENSIIAYELNKTRSTPMFEYTPTNISQFVMNFVEYKDFEYINSNEVYSGIISRLPFKSLQTNPSNRNVSLADSGSIRLQSIGNGFTIELDSLENFREIYSLTWVFDSNGSVMWTTEGSLFISPIDKDGDGFREVGQLQTVSKDPDAYYSSEDFGSNSSLIENGFRFSRVVTMFPENGSVYAMFKLEFSQQEFFNDSNILHKVNYINGSIKPTVAFTKDSKNSEAMNPDIIGIYAIEYLKYESDGTPNIGQRWVPFRLQLDANFAQLEIGQSRVLNNYYNYERYDVHCYQNYADVEFLNHDLDGDQFLDYLITPFSMVHLKNILVIPSSLKQFNNDDEFPMVNYIIENNNRDFIDSQYWWDRGSSSNHDYYFVENQSVFSRYDICDHRKISDIIISFEDPADNNRLSGVIAQYTGFFYYEDLRFKPELQPFSEFFFDFSRMLTLGAIVFLIVNIALGFLFFVKRGKTERVKVSKDLQKLNVIQKIMGIIGAIVLVTIEVFLLVILKPTVEYSALYIGPQASLLWFIIIYPAIFPLYGILPSIYSWASAKYAGWLYIRGQKRSFTWREKLGWLDYDVIVTKMEERNKLHPVYTIKRALLPLSIAFTIGVWIYNALNSSFILTIFNLPAQTNPAALGIWIEGTPLDDIWAEMGKFARYCIFPMLVTYILSSVIIPSGWLLDDAGVAYFRYEKKYRGVNDVEPLSSWLMNIISGVFGMSALLSFVSLFNPMFAQLDDLSAAFNRTLSYVDLGVLNNVIKIGQIAVIVILLALIIYPFVVGIAITVACMQKTEEDYVNNTKRLFAWMLKHKFDPRTIEIKTILNANYGTEPWVNQYDETILGEGKFTMIVRKDDKMNEQLSNLKIDFDQNK